MRDYTRFASSIVLATFAVTPAEGGIAIFDAGTDAIEVSSGSTVLSGSATFEAVILFPSETGAAGLVFNEWTGGQEDLQFFVGPETFLGFLYPLAPPLQGSLALARDEWHHVAYVYDGSEHRFYADGELVAAAPLSGNISGSVGSGYVGASPRGGGPCAFGFVGQLDSLRLSDVARYSGTSFTPTLGDMTSDGNTQLLYNFNDLPGSTSVQDSGPQARTGTLGAGCAEATSPDLEGGAPTTTTTTTTSTTSTTTSTTTVAASSTTSTTLTHTGVCADPVAPLVASRASIVSATDALFALRAAVELESCALCVCDVDGSGGIAATDALMILRLAVGQPIVPNCPAC